MVVVVARSRSDARIASSNLERTASGSVEVDSAEEEGEAAVCSAAPAAPADAGWYHARLGLAEDCVAAGAWVEDGGGVEVR